MVYHSGNCLINPELLFQKARLQSGMHIADLGCGRTGHIVFPAVTVITDKGIIYAVDVIKDILENIKRRAVAENFLEIHTVWSNLERVGLTPIPAQTLDAGFIINVLHQSDNRHAILEEAYRLLKPKARLIVVDWSKKGLPFAPSEERYVDFSDIKNWSTLHGFAVQEEFDMGKYHHGLVLFKHD